MFNLYKQLSLPIATAGICAAGLVNAVAQKTNFVIIFTDDQGYQDLGCYDSPNIKTPRIDQMAREGIRFTDFYAQTVCGPSRAALMTGCYPLRIGRNDDGKKPHPQVSLSEVTIAEVLKPVGYKTCMIGKWDMAGHNQDAFNYELLPSKQGFDHTFVTPGSNDSRVHLLRNGKMIEKNADMSQLTKRYTDEAIKFIDQNAENPFFIYLAHTMPHTKLAVSADFKGKSEGGVYGDVVEELDYNVGRLLDHIKAKGIDDNTYVIFTSDNGPWHKKKEHGGKALPLRGAKTSTWEGGLRVPCVMRAPGKIPAGIESNLVTATIDLLPTLANIAGGTVPTDRVIDGVDITNVIHGKQKQLDRSFFYFQHDGLQAVRKGKWKLHMPTEGSMVESWLPHLKPEDRKLFSKVALFDLSGDIGEKNDVASKNPEVVAEMMKLINWAKQDIGHLSVRGENARALGGASHTARRKRSGAEAGGRGRAADKKKGNKSKKKKKK